jgi:hypothetical protein
MKTLDIKNIKTNMLIKELFPRSHRLVIAVMLLMLSSLVITILVLRNDTNTRSHAATANSVEAESGTISGNVAVIADANTSGGSYVKLGATANPLPFAMPPAETLRASHKKVFAHYFTPYPISQDNKTPETDYYTVHYNNPHGENDKFLKYGSFFRQRPLPQQPLTTSTWFVDNMKTEVNRAVAAGIDGFSLNILNITGGYNHVTANALIQGAEQADPGFRIMLMPDMSILDTVTPTQLADAMTQFGTSPAVFRLDDGRLVISPFHAEARTVSWWQEFIAAMQSRGNTVAFVPVFLDYSYSDQFAPISYGFSNWGRRSVVMNKPGSQYSATYYAPDAHALGKIWMQPVASQDVRPAQEIYDEASNTENLRVTWDSIFAGGADWVQLVTWNDYSEATEFAPSNHTGYGYLDLNSYYIVRFKTGQFPQVTKDALYINHRIQFANAVPQAGSPNTALMKVRAGSDPGRDKVEVISFMQSPANVTAVIGGTNQTYTAQAGLQAQLFDLAYGFNAAAAVRNGQTISTVNSPYEVKQSFQIQDLQYYMKGSNGR